MATVNALLFPVDGTKSNLFASSNDRFIAPITDVETAAICGMTYGPAVARELISFNSATDGDGNVTYSSTVGAVLQALLFKSRMVITEAAPSATGEATVNNIHLEVRENKKVLEFLGWALGAGPQKATASVAALKTAVEAQGSKWGSDETSLLLDIEPMTFNPSKVDNGIASAEEIVTSSKSTTTAVSEIDGSTIAVQVFDADLSQSTFTFKVFDNGETTTGEENFDIHVRSAMLEYSAAAKAFGSVKVDIRDFHSIALRAHLPAQFDSDVVRVFEATQSTHLTSVKFDLFKPSHNLVRGDLTYEAYEPQTDADGNATTNVVLERTRRDDNIARIVYNFANNDPTKGSHRLTLEVVSDAANADITSDAGVLKVGLLANTDAETPGPLIATVDDGVAIGNLMPSELTLKIVESDAHAAIQMPFRKSNFLDAYVEIQFNQTVGPAYNFVSNFITIDTATKGVLPPMPIVCSSHAASGLYLADNIVYPDQPDREGVAALLKTNIKSVNEYMQEYATETVLRTDRPSMYRGFYDQTYVNDLYGRGGFQMDGVHNRPVAADWSKGSGNAYLLLTKSIDTISVDPEYIRVCTNRYTPLDNDGNDSTELRPLRIIDMEGFSDYAQLPDSIGDDYIAKTNAGGATHEGKNWAAPGNDLEKSIAPESYLRLGQQSGYGVDGATPFMYFHKSAEEARYWLDNVVRSDSALSAKSNADAQAIFENSLSLLAWSNSTPENTENASATVMPRKVRFAALLHAGVNDTRENMGFTEPDNNNNNVGGMVQSELQKGDSIRVEYATADGAASKPRTEVFDNLRSVEMSSNAPVTAVFDTTAELMLVEFACQYLDGNQNPDGAGTLLTKTDIANIVVAWEVELQYGSGDNYAPLSVDVVGDGETVSTAVKATLPAIGSDTANSVAARWNIPDLFGQMSQILFADSAAKRANLISTLNGLMIAINNNGGNDYKVAARPIINQSIQLSHAAVAGSTSIAQTHAYNPLTKSNDLGVGSAQNDAHIATIGNQASGKVTARVPASMSTGDVVLSYESALEPGVLMNNKVLLSAPKPKATMETTSSTDDQGVTTTTVTQKDPIMVEYQLATVAVADNGDITVSHSTDGAGNFMDWIVFNDGNTDNLNGEKLSLATLIANDTFPDSGSGSADQLTSQDGDTYPFIIQYTGTDESPYAVSPDAQDNFAPAFFAPKLLEQKNDVGALAFNDSTLYVLRSRAYNWVGDTQTTDVGEIIPGTQSQSKVFRIFNGALTSVGALEATTDGYTILPDEAAQHNVINGLGFKDIPIRTDEHENGSMNIPCRTLLVGGTSYGVSMSFDSDGNGLVIHQDDLQDVNTHPNWVALVAGGVTNITEANSITAILADVVAGGGAADTVVSWDDGLTEKDVAANGKFAFEVSLRANYSLYPTLLDAYNATQSSTNADTNVVTQAPVFTLGANETYTVTVPLANKDFVSNNASGNASITAADLADRQKFGAAQASNSVAVLSGFMYMPSDYSFEYVVSSTGSLITLTADQRAASFAVLPTSNLHLAGHKTTAVLLNGESGTIANPVIATTEDVLNLKLSTSALSADAALESAAAALNNAKGAEDLDAQKAIVAGLLERKPLVRYADKPSLNQLVAAPEDSNKTAAELAALTAQTAITVGGVTGTFTQSIHPVAWKEDGSDYAAWGKTAGVVNGAVDIYVKGANDADELATQKQTPGAGAQDFDLAADVTLVAPTGVLDNGASVELGLPVDAYVELSSEIAFAVSNKSDIEINLAPDAEVAVPEDVRVSFPAYQTSISNNGGGGYARKGQSDAVSVSIERQQNGKLYSSNVVQKGQTDSMALAVIGSARNNSRTFFCVDSEAVANPAAAGYVAIGENSYFVYKTVSRANRGHLEMATMSVAGAALAQSNFKAFESLALTTGQPNLDNVAAFLSFNDSGVMQHTEAYDPAANNRFQAPQ